MGKERNHFSVSLQVEKNKDLMKKTVEKNNSIKASERHPIITSKLEDPHPCNNVLTVNSDDTPPFKKLPPQQHPMNARPRPNNETIEEFFDKHIDFYSQIITNSHLKKPIANIESESPQQNDEEEIPFLESIPLKKGRQKL